MFSSKINQRFWLPFALCSFLFSQGLLDKASATDRYHTAQGVQMQGEKVFPVDWLDSGLLVLNNGENVVLSGVFVPSSHYIHTAQGQQELSHLWQLIQKRVLSRLVTLYSYDTKRDRYRIRYGDIYMGNYGDWLQLSLVAQGWSWVLPSPWASERNQALLIAEKEAREKRRGFWATGDFTRVGRSRLQEKDGFIMLKGKVQEIAIGTDGWRMWVDGIAVHVPVEDYILPPVAGDIVEVRGKVMWRNSEGSMTLKSHYQLLDGGGLQWFEKNGASRN